MDNERIKQEQNRRGEAWLQKKATPEFKCVVCTGREWSAAGVVELRPYEGGNLTLGGGVGTFPAMQFVCNNCGNTVLINAVISGIVRQEDYAAGSTDR